MNYANGFDPEDLRVLSAKRNSELIVAYFSEFKGHRCFHIRKLFESKDGKMHPTREGVTIALNHLPAALTALEAFK